MPGQGNMYRQAPAYIVWIIEAVVPKRYEPVVAFRNGFNAAMVIRPRAEGSIVITGRFVVTRKNVGVVFDIDGRIRDRLEMVLGVDADFGRDHDLFRRGRTTACPQEPCIH